MDIEYQIATNLSYNHVIEKIEHFTFPPIRKKVKSMPIYEPFTGIWAIRNNQLLGVILADSNKNKKSELFSFFVKPDERNKGIGSQLLSMLETILEKQGFNSIQIRYWSNWQSSAVIEKLLKNNNWEPPHLLRVIIQGDIQNYTQAKWPVIKLPSAYDLFPWSELNDIDKENIDHLIRNKTLPDEFNPYQHTDKICKPVSFGLRHNGELIGWNIVYSQTENTLEYNNLYIRGEYRKMGYAISLLHRSFDEHYRMSIPKAIWIINANNPVVMKIAKRIAGDLVNYAEVKVSEKKLRV